MFAHFVEAFLALTALACIFFVVFGTLKKRTFHPSSGRLRDQTGWGRWE